jgi:4-amino-4-deoxy-L-arabinose transferase
MAHIDPFLHIWDERFHALVARNMMDMPFKPMLRANPVLPPDSFSWTQSSLWLHKPPLFMWQMALSMKLFGTTVYALRYPSVLMGTLMIPMVYSVASTITKDKLVAVITAGLFCFSNFHLELVAGIRSMDHNDLCLEFYVLASVWAWIKYEESRKWHWLVLIGIFAGAAILTKWLIGLFVYLAWGVRILFDMKQKLNLKEIVRYIFSLLVCCIVFLPWQFFIMKHYPVEARFEYNFINRHISEVVEGHAGTVFFYLARFPQLFGEGICWLIFPGIYLFFKKSRGIRNIKISIVAACFFVCLFLSAIASKTVSHIYFIAPFCFMFIAIVLARVLSFIKKKYIAMLLLLAVFIVDAKPEKILLDQYANNEQRIKDIHNARIYGMMASKLPQGAVVLNVPDCISFMFFNKGAVAYENFSEEQMKTLQENKVPVFAFDHVKNRPLPHYVLQYPYLRLIQAELR